MRNVAIGIVLGLMFAGAVVLAAPVEEMHQNDRLTFETDTVNGKIVKYPSVIVKNIRAAIAGERLQDQASKSYLAVRTEANAAIIGKTTAVTIGAGSASDTHLLGLHISTALTGTCVLAGFADSDGTATNYTLPVGSVGYKDFLGILNTAGALTVTCSNASDDNLVMVLWRPAI